MKLYTYEKEGQEYAGVLSADGEWIYPVTAAVPGAADMKQLICRMDERTHKNLQDLLQLVSEQVDGAVRKEEVKVLAPIVHPQQDIICLGVNYMAHAEESARFKGEKFDGERPYAVYFSKRVNEAVADGAIIPAHENLVDSLDYEAELAVIIGKDAKNVKREDAYEYIFGYTILNDVSARNVQNRHKQWYFGKSLDGFTPMGPCIVTKDAITWPPKLSIQSKVNGELRQDSNTELLIFDIAFVIEELSSGMTLKAGTIISMGTPAGVGMGFTPPKFLKTGDTVECIVEGIGNLKNIVK